MIQGKEPVADKGLFWIAAGQGEVPWRSRRAFARSIDAGARVVFTARCLPTARSSSPSTGTCGSATPFTPCWRLSRWEISTGCGRVSTHCLTGSCCGGLTAWTGASLRASQRTTGSTCIPASSRTVRRYRTSYGGCAKTTRQAWPCGRWAAGRSASGSSNDYQDFHLLQKLVWYLDRIGHPHVADAGIWEEEGPTKAVHLSSVGAVAAGLTQAARIGVKDLPERLQLDTT